MIEERDLAQALALGSCRPAFEGDVAQELVGAIHRPIKKIRLALQDRHMGSLQQHSLPRIARFSAQWQGKIIIPALQRFSKS